MNTPVFSISVPVGAYHPFLKDCLASLFAQNVRLNISLLDASGDARVKALGDQHNDRLAYRRHGPDKGQSDAILEGWENTPGDILGWLNADDILFPNTLTLAQSAFKNEPALAVIYGHSSILDDQGRMTGYHWAVEPPGPRLLEAGIISQPSCFFRRAAYEKAGGLNPDLHYTMDWDLWIRLYKSGAKFGFIDDVLSMVLWGDDTKTSTFSKTRRRELRNIINTHAPKGKHKKIFRSFAIQNLIDRIHPQFLRDSIVSALVKERKTVCGLGQDGTITDNCTLILAHYETSRTGAEIAFSRPPQQPTILINGRNQNFVVDGNNCLIGFNTPLPAGVRVAIDVSVMNHAKIRHCRLT